MKKEQDKKSQQLTIIKQPNVNRPLVNKLNKIEKSLKKLALRKPLPRDPMEYRKMQPAKVVDALNDFHKRTRSQYLYSMIHPDYAVTEGIQVKMYSDVPVPTSSIGIRSMYQISTSSKGTFMLTWSPNFLAIDGEIRRGINIADNKGYTTAYSNLVFTNDHDITGTSEVSNNNVTYTALPGFMPSVILQKYRLVSAIMKVKYNGSVLNQAGTMISCATFDNLPVMNCISTNETYDAGTLLNNRCPVDLVRNRYTDFSLIRNGLWNYSTNITANANGLECLYVPTDPTANIFYDLASYYGSTDKTVEQIIQTEQTLGYIQQITGDSGSQLSYVVAGHNLPAMENCIQIEIFSNFEVIADPSVAPLLRSTINQTFDWNDKRRIEDLFKDISQTGFIRKVYEKVKEKFPSFAKATLTWGPRLLPLITKLL